MLRRPADLQLLSVGLLPRCGVAPYSAVMTYGLRDMDGERVELCDECGFDAREPRDLATAFAEVYASLEHFAGHPDADRRPEAETWSGREYADHCVEVAEGILAALADQGAGRAESGSVVSLAQAAAATAELVRDLSDAQWAEITDGWPFDVSVRGAVLHLLHDLEHHLLDVRRGYAKLALADGIEVVTST